MFTTMLTTIVLAGNSFAPTPDPDPRWQAWLGCWQPAEATGRRAREAGTPHLACVIPTNNPAAVEVVTIENGAVAGRETIQVTGSHLPNDRGGCSGWESADWSPEGSRVYISSEQSCSGGLVRKSSGVLSISGSGDWLDVRGLSSGGNAGVRVLRYRPVDLESVGDGLPAEVLDALRNRNDAILTARMDAGRRLNNDDVIEASHRLDASVVEAWLIENRQGFAVDARDLTHLANAGVPGSVTDIMIALSFPRVFAIDRDSRSSEPRRPEMMPEGYREPDIISVWDPFGYSPWGYGGYGGYGYGPYGLGGYGWYTGRTIVVVGDTPPATGEAAEGQAVKGRGYRKRGGSDSSGGSSQSDRPRASSGSSNSGDSGGSSAPAPSSGGSSSGSGRTAHPRN